MANKVIVVRPKPVIRVVKVRNSVVRVIKTIKQGMAGAVDYDSIFRISNLFSELNTPVKKQTALTNLGAFPTPTSIKNGEVLEVVGDQLIPTHQWITLATAFTVDPVLLFSNATTEIYQYQYGSTTLYRSITDAQDAFYQTYDNTSHALTGLIASKQISISV